MSCVSLMQMPVRSGLVHGRRQPRARRLYPSSFSSFACHQDPHRHYAGDCSGWPRQVRIHRSDSRIKSRRTLVTASMRAASAPTWRAGRDVRKADSGRRAREGPFVIVYGDRESDGALAGEQQLASRRYQRPSCPAFRGLAAEADLMTPPGAAVYHPLWQRLFNFTSGLTAGFNRADKKRAAVARFCRYKRS
jgi:hypothetical protein